MQVIFYSYILSKFQNFMPIKGFVINGEKREISFEIEEEYSEFEEFREFA